MVATNRDMLLAIAGVFFLLPQLAQALLPMPELAAGGTPQQALDTFTQFYSARPYLLGLMLLLSLPALVGHLTMLSVLIDPRRPTVGQAIRTGLALMPGYFAMQILIGFGLFVLLVVVTGALSMLLPPAIGAVVALIAAIYPLIRVVLAAADMVVGHHANPVRAIARSVERTRGQVLGLLLFLVPAIAIFAVVFLLVLIFVNPLLALVLHGEPLRLAGEAIAATMSAVGQTYYAAIIAATYGQLDSADRIGGPFSPSNPS